MGVDIPDIECVVLWGAPRGLKNFAQESGSAGGDDRQSSLLIYYTGHDISKARCTEEVRDLCTSNSCKHDVLNHHFQLDNCKGKTGTSHNCCCCSNCLPLCKSGGCITFECMFDLISNSSDTFDDSVRHLSDSQLKLLKANLMDYQECLLEKGSESLELFDNAI